MEPTSSRGATVSAQEAGVPRWVRLGVVVLLAVPQIVTGAWAVIATKNWYESFPGVDPRLVAAEPPYNAHLATDAGAGFLATGLALAFAAVWGRRSGIVVALVAYGAFAIPHFVYHAAHPAPGLSDAENVFNDALLASSLVFAAVLAWGTLRSRVRSPAQPADR